MRQKKAALVLLSCLLLTACGIETRTIIRIKYLGQHIDPSLLSCAAEPAVPAKPTDKAVAWFIVDLVSAGDDCRGKLAAVKSLREETTVRQKMSEDF